MTFSKFRLGFALCVLFLFLAPSFGASHYEQGNVKSAAEAQTKCKMALGQLSNVSFPLYRISDSLYSGLSFCDAALSQFSTTGSDFRPKYSLRQIGHAISRIFTDPWRAFVELLSNAHDSHLMKLGKTVVGFFGLGFFSSLKILDEVPGSTVVVQTCYYSSNSSFFFDDSPMMSNESKEVDDDVVLSSYEMRIFGDASSPESMFAFSDGSNDFCNGSTGTTVSLLPPEGEEFDVEKLRSVRQYMHYYDFFPHRTILAYRESVSEEFSISVIGGFGDDSEEGSIPPVFVRIGPLGMQVRDFGNGIPFGKVLYSLLVPSETGKSKDAAFFEELETSWESEDEDTWLSTEFVQYLGKNPDDTSSHLIVTIAGVVVTDVRMDNDDNDLPLFRDDEGHALDTLIQLVAGSRLDTGRDMPEIGGPNQLPTFPERQLKRIINRTIDFVVSGSDGNRAGSSDRLAALFRGLEAMETKSSKATHFAGRFSSYLRDMLAARLREDESLLPVPLVHAEQHAKILEISAGFLPEEKPPVGIPLDPVLTNYNYAGLERYYRRAFLAAARAEGKKGKLSEDAIEEKIVSGRRVFFVRDEILQEKEVDTLGLRMCVFARESLLQFVEKKAKKGGNKKSSSSREMLGEELSDRSADPLVPLGYLGSDTFVTPARILSSMGGRKEPGEEDWVFFHTPSFRRDLASPIFWKNLSLFFPIFRKEHIDNVLSEWWDIDGDQIVELFARDDCVFGDLPRFGPFVLIDQSQKKSDGEAGKKAKKYRSPEGCSFPKIRLRLNEDGDRLFWFDTDNDGKKVSLELHEFANALYAVGFIPTALKEPGTDWAAASVDRKAIASFVPLRGNRSYSPSAVRALLFGSLCNLPEEEVSLPRRSRAIHWQEVCGELSDFYRVQHLPRHYRYPFLRLVRDYRPLFSEADQPVLRAFATKHKSFLFDDRKTSFLVSNWRSATSDSESETPLLPIDVSSGKTLKKEDSVLRWLYLSNTAREHHGFWTSAREVPRYLFYSSDNWLFLPRPPVEVGPRRGDELPESWVTGLESSTYHHILRIPEEIRDTVASNLIPIDEFFNDVFRVLLLRFNVSLLEEKFLVGSRQVYPRDSEAAPWTTELLEEVFSLLMGDFFSSVNEERTGLLEKPLSDSSRNTVEDILEGKTNLGIPYVAPVVELGSGGEVVGVSRGSSDVDLTFLQIREFSIAVSFQRMLRRYRIPGLNVLPPYQELIKWIGGVHSERLQSGSERILRGKDVLSNLNEVREGMLSLLTRYINVPDSNFRASVYGKASATAIPVSFVPDVTPETAYDFLVGLQELENGGKLTEKLLLLSSLEFEMQTCDRERKKDIAGSEKFFLRRPLSATPVSACAALWKKGIPIEVIRAIIENSQSPPEIMFVAHAMFVDKIFAIVKNRVEGVDLSGFVGVAINKLLREFIGKNRVLAVVDSIRRMVKLSDRVKHVKEESAVKSMALFLEAKTTAVEKFPKRHLSEIIGEETARNLVSPPDQRENSFLLKQWMTFLFRNTLKDELDSNVLSDELLRKIQSIPKMAIGDLRQIPQESIYSSANAGGEIVEMVQNAADAMRECAADPKCAPRIRPSMEFTISTMDDIDSLPILEAGLKSSSLYQHLLLSLHDWAGFPDLQTMLIDLLIAGYSEKPSGNNSIIEIDGNVIYLTVGEMGTGFYKLFKRSRMIFILTHFTSDPIQNDSRTLLVVEPIRDSQGIPYRLRLELKRLSAKELSALGFWESDVDSLNGTTVFILFNSQRSDLALVELVYTWDYLRQYVSAPESCLPNGERIKIFVNGDRTTSEELHEVILRVPSTSPQQGVCSLSHRFSFSRFREGNEFGPSVVSTGGILYQPLGPFVADLLPKWMQDPILRGHLMDLSRGTYEAVTSREGDAASGELMRTRLEFLLNSVYRVMLDGNTPKENMFTHYGSPSGFEQVQLTEKRAFEDSLEQFMANPKESYLDMEAFMTYYKPELWTNRSFFELVDDVFTRTLYKEIKIERTRLQREADTQFARIRANFTAELAILVSQVPYPYEKAVALLQRIRREFWEARKKWISLFRTRCKEFFTNWETGLVTADEELDKVGIEWVRPKVEHVAFGLPSFNGGIPPPPPPEEEDDDEEEEEQEEEEPKEKEIHPEAVMEKLWTEWMESHPTSEDVLGELKTLLVGTIQSFYAHLLNATFPDLSDSRPFPITFECKAQSSAVAAFLPRTLGVLLNLGHSRIEGYLDALIVLIGPPSGGIRRKEVIQDLFIGIQGYTPALLHEFLHAVAPNFGTNHPAQYFCPKKRKESVAFDLCANEIVKDAIGKGVLPAWRKSVRSKAPKNALTVLQEFVMWLQTTWKNAAGNFQDDLGNRFVVRKLGLV